jgi:hypothetical protein
MDDGRTEDIQEWRRRREALTVDRKHLSQMACKLQLKASAMRGSTEAPKCLADSLLVERRILSEHVAWCRRSMNEIPHTRNPVSTTAAFSYGAEGTRACWTSDRLDIAATLPDAAIRIADLSSPLPPESSVQRAIETPVYQHDSRPEGA